MKVFSFVAASTLAILSTVNHTAATATGGVCYDPDHVDAVTEATISADFQTIKEKGFDLGLNVSLGVPFDNDNPSATADYVTAAISAGALSNGSASVVQIFVGNENLASVDEVPSELLSYITQLQEALPMCPSAPYSATPRCSTRLVTTPSRAWPISSSLRRRGRQHPACLHGRHCCGRRHHARVQPVDGTAKQRHRVALPWSGRQLAITETGWPSAGSADGNTGSVTGAEQFYSDYMTWATENLDASRSHYFQMFDLPSRTDTVFEAHFGICDEDGNDKFTL
ncbi:Glycoside hydrolase superfamily [Phytophthora cactorum]|nr:Glycoside hydrolase superfamily [Phytophthora cactorum]